MKLSKAQKKLLCEVREFEGVTMRDVAIENRSGLRTARALQRKGLAEIRLGIRLTPAGRVLADKLMEEL